MTAGRARDLEAAILAALDELGTGDYETTEAILVNSLEDAVLPRSLCPECGLDLRFPGLRDHHLRFVHGLETEAAA
jgi:hypothetical protein